MHYAVRAAGVLLAAATVVLSLPAAAGGGYFLLGYGPFAEQSAGTSTAIGFDAFSGATNPAKLSAVADRVDLGVIAFMPHRKIQRSGSGTVYDFATTSNNEFFLLPEGGIAHRINDRFSWGLTLYGNGGLNTEYPGNTGVPGTNANPQACGNRPGNFFLGCGKLGIDITQAIIAPTVSWQVTPKHSIGIAPLIGYQRFDAYGLQAFQGFSQQPGRVTNNGHDDAFGAGVRVGWFGQITPWLDAGAAWSSRIYMQKFDKYKGLLAGGGDFDIPENYSVGVAIKPLDQWTVGLDIQRIRFGQIKALGNGVLNSLQDPAGSPLGSDNGSGFNWRTQTNYKIAVEYKASPSITIRSGYAYGKRAQADDSANSVSFNLFAPNPLHQVSIGFSCKLGENGELNFGYSRYIEGSYDGPSATAGLGVGGNERITPYVDQYHFGWSWHL